MHLQIKSYYLALFAIFSIFVFILYQPGLYSIFLLDDHINLKDLSTIHSYKDIQNLIAVTFNGISSQAGRPISMFSFVLQFESWPNHPYSFKLVNVLIHLINGLLIFLLSRSITTYPSLAFSEKEASIISLLIASFWVVHPIQVSTVLYTVQRMTELSALFTLSGLLLYVKGRKALVTDQCIKNYFIISIGLIIGLLLGILSKENAILICLFVLSLEGTIFRHHQTNGLFRIWLALFTYVPLATLFIYLAPKIYPYLFTEYPIRTYSAIERLLTEFRILSDYLFKIWLPRLGTYGLFHANFEISTSIINPINTLFSFIFIVSLLITGFRLRKKNPLTSFGIFFFFSAHALESTLLNLELYFEHRNYLASFGAIVVLINLLFQFYHSEHFSKSIRKILFVSITLVWLLVSTLITWNENKLWSLPDIQAKIWAESNPNSYRAQGHYSHILTQMGKFNEAYQNYQKNMDILTRDAAIPILWLQLRCYDPEIPSPDLEGLKTRILASEFQNAVILTFNEIAEAFVEGKCAAIDPKTTLNLINLYIDSPQYQSDLSMRSLLIIRSKFERIIGDFPNAATSLERANRIEASADIYLGLIDIYSRLKLTNELTLQLKQLRSFCKKSPLKCLPYMHDIKNIDMNQD